MKQLEILLFLGCLFTSYCSAQSAIDLKGEESKGPVIRTRPAKAVNKFAVIFTSDDTCNLKIDGYDYGKIIHDKTIRLPLGNYRLFFESLQTGKTIKNRSFRLTGDSLTGGTYRYLVIFD